MRFSKPIQMAVLLLFVGIGLTGCSSTKSYDESMDLGGINVGEALAGLIAHTQQVMSKVTNMSSAEQAQPKLHRISQDFDDLIYHVPNMTDDGQFALAMQARKALPEIQGMANQIQGVPALYDIIGVELDEIAAKLAQLQ